MAWVSLSDGKIIHFYENASELFHTAGNFGSIWIFFSELGRLSLPDPAEVPSCRGPCQDKDRRRDVLGPWFHASIDSRPGVRGSDPLQASKNALPRARVIRRILRCERIATIGSCEQLIYHQIPAARTSCHGRRPDPRSATVRRSRLGQQDASGHLRHIQLRTTARAFRLQAKTPASKPRLPSTRCPHMTTISGSVPTDSPDERLPRMQDDHIEARL